MRNLKPSKRNRSSVKASKRSVKAAYGGWGKFYGIDDVEFTVPNDMDDPTIYYNGKYYNYYDIEDSLWSYYKEECEENNTVADEEDFENWVAGNSYLVYDLLDIAPAKDKPGRGVYRKEPNTLRSAKASKRRPMRKSNIKAAESYGWVVEDWDAQEAYEFACDYFGEEDLNAQIVRAISNEELAACLAFIFRMNEFSEWEEYKNGADDEDEDIESSTRPKHKGGMVVKSSVRRNRRR